MFSDQGEKQFAPHRNRGEDHFAEIVFAPDGFTFPSFRQKPEFGIFE
jgi:hypothetical protein